MEIKQKDNTTPLDISKLGAIGDGITDNTTTFISIYNRAVANNETIYVPTGTYRIQSISPFPKRYIFYGEGRVVDNSNNILFTAKYSNTNTAFIAQKYTYGTYNHAAVGGFVANSYRKLPVIGIPSDQESTFVTYPDRDSVALYVENNGTVWDKCLNSVTYTSNTVTTTDNISNLKIDMIIDTLHTPYKYTGKVRSISGQTITVGAWYLVDATTLTPQIPTDGIGFVINPATKIWGLNLNNFISGDSDTNASTGLELGMFCDKVGSTNWGIDVVNFSSTVKAEIGYQARRSSNSGAKIKKGFLARDCETAYEVYSEDANAIAFFTAYQQSNINWMLLASGAMNKMKLMYHVIGDGILSSPDDNKSCLFFERTIDNQNYTLYTSAGREGYSLWLTNNSNVRVNIVGYSGQTIKFKRNALNSFTLPPMSSIILISKGSTLGWNVFSQTFSDDSTGIISPISSVIPLFIGENYLDTVAKKWYKSTGLTNADWVALN